MSANSSYLGSTELPYKHGRNNATNIEKTCLLSAEDAEGCAVGVGIVISPAWTQKSENRDVSFYLDSVAVSLPNVVIAPGTSYDFMSGTSMATPAVCGAGALITMLNPRRENETGRDYAKRTRAELLSCVRQTEQLKDLCSTGGYIDLSLLNEGIPSISDAVCDLETETITLFGKNLTAGCTLTCKRLAADGAEEQPLPDGMSFDCSDDGTRLVIRHAKSLFSTYTAFTVTTENGMKGTGKFFLVKGQNKLTMVQEHFETGGTPTPYLLTDAENRKLYGYFKDNGTVAYYDGNRFNIFKNSELFDASKQYLTDRGEDVYSVRNGGRVALFRTDVPICENGVIYNLMEFFIPEPADGGGTGYRTEYSLASFDLNADEHRWHFSPMPEYPEGVMTERGPALTPGIYNGKIFIIGDSISAGATDTTLPFYSYDLETKEWTREPDLPYIAENCDIVQTSGRLYVMFGFDPDTQKTNEERFLSSVWCFDGEKWELKRDDLHYVGRFNDNNGTLFHSDAITPVGNGLIFFNASVDGGGNLFLYNTDTDEIEPLYYTVFDTLCDARDENQSCVATRDGIYYLYQFVDDTFNRNGWKLCLTPADSGLYDDPFEDFIVGDADGDGKVTIADATMIQKYLAEFAMPDNFVLKACDVNGDGKVNVSDVTELQRYLAEMVG